MGKINIKYLKENNLMEAHKHFMRLSEAYIPSFPEEELEEDDNEQQPNDGMGMVQDPNAQMGGDMTAPQDPNMGGMPDANSMGGMGAPQDPNTQMGGDMGMPQDPSMGGMPSTDPTAMGDEGLDDESSTEDENTIDINGLTKAQDKLNIKQNHIGRDLSKVDNRILTLIDTIKGLQDKLDNNNSELESLKAEFEKRNPTQTEKLNLRSLDSYPFNVKPNEYWSQKAKEGGYETYADNSEPTTQEYVITNDDVDNPSDDIAKTFFKIDDDDIQTLDKLFKL
jgi:hypothetical protein